MTKRPFIPKPMRNYKGTIWKNYTFLDLVILFLFVTVDIFTVLALTGSVWIKLAVATGVLLPYPFVVVPFGTEKFYFRVFWFLAYLFSKKVYFRRESKLLYPYNKIRSEEAVIETTTKRFIRVIELKGFNLNLLHENEQHYRIGSFQQFIKNTSSFSLVSVSLPLDYSAQEETIANIQAWHTRNKALKHAALVEKCIFDKLIALKTNYGDKYFLFIEGGSEQETRRKYQAVQSFLRNAHLFPAEVKDQTEIAKVITALNLNTQNRRVSFRRDYLKVDKWFQRIMCVRGLPQQAFEGWLANLNRKEGVNWVMHAEKLDKEKAGKKLDKVIGDLRGNTYLHKKASEEAKNLTYLRGMEELNELVHMGEEEFESLRIFLSVKANSLTALDKQTREIRFTCLGSSIYLDPLLWRQKEALSSMFIGTKNQKTIASTELSSVALAYGFPFLGDEHLDPHGLYLGFSLTSGRNVVFDPRVRDNQRKNGNIFALGTPGGGKSTLFKKLIKNLVLLKAKMFVLDPEREYDHLCHNLGGSWINFGTDTSKNQQNNVINPLQFLQNETGDRDLLQTHLQFLEEFFRTLFPELEQKEINFLRVALLKAYARKRIRSSNSFKHRRNTSYPLMQEVVDIIKELLDSEQDPFNIPIWKELLVYMGVFRTKTPEAAMWNGYTNFDIYNNYLTVADLQTLFVSGNKRLANAQMFLLLKLVNNIMIQNKTLKDQKLANQSFGIVVDEAHLLVDERAPFALNFMYEMAKRARKYNGFVAVTTQNVKDFMGSNKATRDKTGAILNVCQYGFIFQLNAGDIQDLDNLLSSSGGLMEQEKTAVALGNTGEALFMSGTKKRQLIKVDVANEEFALWEK